MGSKFYVFIYNKKKCHLSMFWKQREEEEHIKQQTNTSWFLLSMTT